MIFDLFLMAWKQVALMMFILWVVQVKTKNASYVDLGWVTGIWMSCFLFAVRTGPLNLRKEILLILVSLWTTRLGTLLVLRLNKEDSRYTKIRNDWKKFQNFKFFLMYQFQGLISVALSWGYLIICLNSVHDFSPLEYGGVLLWIVGFVGEAMADNQLKLFKADPSNEGKICEEGLWHYSRHPNYFFEWVMWLAYFLMALAAPFGWTAVVMPILMYYFLMHVSGVPLAEEQSLRTKGEDYRRYQKTTSVFMPLPRKKSWDF